jgi:hypothetical protein
VPNGLPRASTAGRRKLQQRSQDAGLKNRPSSPLLDFPCTPMLMAPMRQWVFRHGGGTTTSRVLRRICFGFHLCVEAEILQKLPDTVLYVTLRWMAGHGGEEMSAADRGGDAGCADKIRSKHEPSYSIPDSDCTLLYLGEFKREQMMIIRRLGAYGMKRTAVSGHGIHRSHTAAEWTSSASGWQACRISHHVIAPHATPSSSTRPSHGLRCKVFKHVRLLILRTPLH